MGCLRKSTIDADVGDAPSTRLKISDWAMKSKTVFRRWWKAENKWPLSFCINAISLQCGSPISAEVPAETIR
jgi:hypothetical protein